ncbi:DUF1837 domain-containing protein (plasmid) [Azospirillum oryzae]|uniref:DUF1837 domain-containing protein n=1 Tax=Azospirillum oryzae TaxID=286727 RepID=A0A6N1AQC3_9PROT|nr:DUF1837 domain-containing protein [Azospirillum oryzae]KAA0587909.1 DUF1837 domain-containing protein [Azospirillum oryzae]QKS54025.1 DUF1837 domain-containing protein [Azospirillum oryzae]GLR77832.1 hypothetical protein GCM10007856_05000 [Azospirillum oryzae]
MPDIALGQTGFSLNDALGLLLGKHDRFEPRVRKATWAGVAGFPRVNTHFYYLSFRDGLPTVSEFAEYLKWQMVPFCIPRRDRARTASMVATATDDAERTMHFVRQFEKARDLFIKTREQQRRAGEPGELILFVLLEWALRAPQLVSKMYLKTSAQMPVHGTDGIHAGMHEDGSTLLLYWGESKLHKGLSDALDSAFESVGEFVMNADRRKREIDIVRDHMDLGEDQQAFRGALLDYLDPYSEQGNQRRDVFACFIGFDYAKYEQLRRLPPDKIEAEFARAFDSRVAGMLDLVGNRLSAKGMDVVNFEFFLLPFPSVADFRMAFFQAAGIANAE